MQFEKKSVRLGDIRPSGQNPREDFGDIGALARSIEATGGEPLNPPVVVADGNVFRIVDGERRYRALSSIYGEDREVSALVADTMDEANELVAMLATDDKRQLTEAERARGVQQMLVLGIDEQRIERASRATAGQIRAARKLRGRIDAGVQVTLEQLEAASAFDDEKDVEAVLAAGDGWAGKADSIRRRVEREEAKAEDYDAFGDAGIPVVKEQPEGFNYTDWANVGLAAQKLEGKEFAAGTVAVWKGSYWDLYEPDDGSGAEPEKTEEEIRAEQEAAREKTALEGLYRSLIGFVASGSFSMSRDLMMCVRTSREDPSALLVLGAATATPRTRSVSGSCETSSPATSRPAGPTSTRPAAGSWRRPRTWPSSTTAGAATTLRRGSTTMTSSAPRASSPARRTCGSWRGFRRAPRRRRMSSEKKVRVTVEACGEVCAFECRGAALSTINGDGSGNSCFVGSASLSDLFALACECTDALCAAFSQVGVPDRNARKLMLIAALGANPHKHADSVQITDLDARREIRDMAAELGVDVDF